MKILPACLRRDVKFIEGKKETAPAPQNNFPLIKSPEQIIKELDYRLAYLKENDMSITEEYSDWVLVGFSVAGCQKFNVTPETCRKYFHEFSKLDKSYTKTKADTKFDSLLKDAKMDQCGPEKIWAMCAEKGYGKKGEPGVVYIVESMLTSRYYMAHKNTGKENRVKLDDTPNEFNVVLAKAKEAETMALTKNEIGFKNQQNRFVYLKMETVKARHRVIPLRKAMLLGEKEPGLYYNKEKRRLEEADHGIPPSKPVRHEEIDEFLDGFPLKKEWAQKYLSYLTDCSRALPWLHFFGESNSGKTLFGKLLASCFTTKTPITDFFLVDGFQDSAGHNPVLMIGEEIPKTRGGINTVNLIKEMVTSYEWTVNKKNLKGLMIVGYPRVISTVNTTDFIIPTGDVMDFGALRRRIQLGRFGKKHVTNMRRFTKTKIDAWFDCKFREYVEWCKQNITVGQEEQQDVLALAPYATEDLNEDSINISNESTNVMHEILNQLNKKTVDPVYQKYEDGNFYFKVSQDFVNYLYKERITPKLMNTRSVSDICDKFFGKLVRSKPRINKKQHRCRILPQEIFDKTAKKLKFDVD